MRSITYSGVWLRNAANFHVAMNRVEGATFWSLTIDSPADARNTDGIDVRASQDVTITHTDPYG
ncbi:glycosyl hydrolase family 28 protein [Bradyrhizobium glycinis]|uniref:glycosyl hydrolase family 28 protein n=1 Tax=Bradyrhizobium glycinis TaxID=2751812 RepID=UPI001FE860DD|nr:glycosyl hydrolase family 28 protein [Bradyrhizobium glycinis]